MEHNFKASDELKEIIKNISAKSLNEFLKNSSLVRDEKLRRNRKEVISNISSAFRDEELVLVLGAGISVPYNIPNWANLLQKLLLKTFNNDETKADESFVLSMLFPELFPNSPLISARFLEQSFKNKKGETFEEVIKDAIYEKVKREENSLIIKEILQLCIAPGKSPNLNSIITYNYDDILEYSLKNSGVEIPFKAIYKAGLNAKNGELPIYHVHGYLPEREEFDNGHSITLSESLYHKQYNDIYSWNNLVQINKFKDNTCIFIGLSLTDPNIRRLLDIAKIQRGSTSKTHYLFKKKYDFNDVKKNLGEILKKNSYLLDRKSNANLELNETTKFLLKRMEEFEELDAESFGMKIIWVAEFDEIATYLKEIRVNKL